VGNLQVNFTILVHFPTKITSLFYPVFKFSYLCICDIPLNCYYFTNQSYPFAHLTSIRRITKFIIYKSSAVVADMGDHGHNRHGPKRGGVAMSLSRSAGNPSIQCGLRRCLLPYQVVSLSIKQFGHNSVGCHSPHRNISTKYYLGLVVEMHTVPVRSDDARYLLN